MDGQPLSSLLSLHRASLIVVSCRWSRVQHLQVPTPSPRRNSGSNTRGHEEEMIRHSIGLQHGSKGMDDHDGVGISWNGPGVRMGWCNVGSVTLINSTNFSPD